MFLLFNFTFSGWIIFWLCFAVCVIAAVYTFISFIKDSDFGWQGFVFSLICTILVLGISYGVSWYNTNTAEGQRSIKNDQSNLQGGLDRKISIYYYGEKNPIVFEGKIDLKNTEDYKVLEFVLNGKKYIYYVGIMDRYIVEEK